MWRLASLLGCLLYGSAQDSGAPFVALSTQLSNAMAAAYSGSTASPWAKPGAPPSATAWKGAARTKYLNTELAAAGYPKLDSLDKRFRDVSLALAMDWELVVADTYALLQAGYETIHPWRTGCIVKKNWTESQGNRFAALTSSVGDVLLMELSKQALVDGTTWPHFDRALWFGQYQEVVAEAKLTQDDWQLYTCDEPRNPIIQQNAARPDIHWIPQLTWITMPLDLATFLGDVLRGDLQSKWALYEKRGAALWEEYQTVHAPVVRELLTMLRSDAGDGGQVRPNHRESSSPSRSPVRDPADLIVKARAAVTSAIQEYKATEGRISDNTYSLVRSLLLSVGIGSNTSSPATPTCAHSHSTATLV